MRDKELAAGRKVYSVARVTVTTLPVPRDALAIRVCVQHFPLTCDQQDK